MDCSKMIAGYKMKETEIFRQEFFLFPSPFKEGAGMEL